MHSIFLKLQISNIFPIVRNVQHSSRYCKEIFALWFFPFALLAAAHLAAIDVHQGCDHDFYSLFSCAQRFYFASCHIYYAYRG